MAPTEMTRPKVGEFSIVSMLVYTGWLKTFVADMRTSNMRDSFSGKTLVIAMSNTTSPGPFDAVAAGIAVLPKRRSDKCGDIEPLRNAGIRQADRLAG